MSEIQQWLTSVGTLFLGIAAIAGGLGVIGRKSAKLIKGPWHGFTAFLRDLWKSRWTAAALAAVITGAFILLVRPFIPAPCEGVNMSITSPVDGAVVNQSQPVLGTINHLCAGQHLWLVLQPGDGGYFPQQEVAVTTSAGRWSTATYFGRPLKADDGLRYALLAVVADDSANQKFRAHLISGNATGNYPALPGLDNATVLSQITVTRGPYLSP
jgi:hypothetical protein